MFRWLAVLLVMMCLATTTGCDFLNPDVATVSDVETFIGVDFPADATDLHFEVGGFQDAIVWLRFDTTPESRSAYVAALGFDEPLTEVNRPSMDSASSETLPWWNVEEVEPGMGGSYDNFNANLHFQILVDPIDSTHERVYLIVFNT
ncbi:MAG TPA: hypothetical protein VHL11_23640 [Phototrophicaceae bacterium]|jgi:hypothetical protein|nr:hypothetical protein [Phototrophicaceae bacterium]